MICLLFQMDNVATSVGIKNAILIWVEAIGQALDPFSIGNPAASGRGMSP